MGSRLGRYELLRELGEGGMASVFAALDTELKREVAVKVMYPHLARRQEGAARFKREARAAASLDHPHILRVLDVGGGEVVDGLLESPHIVLELIDGQTLAEFFDERPPPLAEVIAATGAALCSALAVAHDKGIIHRDIKPANVMTNKDGRLVLADFGVARVSEEDSVVTRTGALVGTPAFMSPEQAQGAKVDPRSDLYSVGATLYTLATGSLPYEGSTAQVVSSILDGKRVPADRRNPRLGRELSRLIDRLMSIEPSDRYQDAREVQAVLLQIARDGGFDDPEALLTSYYASPEAQEDEQIAIVVAATIKRAQQSLHAGRTAQASSLVERLLALAPDNQEAHSLSELIGTPTKRRVWIAVVAVASVAAAAGVALWPVAEVDPIVAVSLDSGPLAAALPQSEDAANGIVLVSVADAAPADASVLDARGRLIRRPPRKVPDASPPVAVIDADVRSDAMLAPIEPSSLIVDIKPWCDVSIDGVRVGRASATKKHKLAPGAHEIRCAQADTGNNWQKTITLAPGESQTLTGTVLGTIRVTLKLSTGDSVRLAKRVYRNGQTIELPVDRYRIEIMRDGLAVSEAKYLTLRRNCVLQDRPTLACFGR